MIGIVYAKKPTVEVALSQTAVSTPLSAPQFDDTKARVMAKDEQVVPSRNFSGDSTVVAADDAMTTSSSVALNEEQQLEMVLKESEREARLQSVDKARE